jgi:hypothetical protein
MRTITLSLSRTGWNATFHGDDVIYGLFGTYTIPTAFTARAAFDTVRASIQQSNPHHNIERGCPLCELYHDSA